MAEIIAYQAQLDLARKVTPVDQIPEKTLIAGI